MKKNDDQMAALIEHFERNPVWNYPKKIAIANETGMTVG